jgi:hypothetical protein
MRRESITFVRTKYPQHRCLTEQFPAGRSSGLHIKISTLRLHWGSADFTVEHVNTGSTRSIIGVAIVRPASGTRISRASAIVECQANRRQQAGFSEPWATMRARNVTSLRFYS